jgi:hypothetical protein
MFMLVRSIISRLACRNRVEAMGIKQVVTASRSPWQNTYVDRVIGSIRRECLDHIRDLQRAPSTPRPILLCRLLPRNPHTSLTRQGLSKLSPDSAWQLGRVVAIPKVGGLHHRYERLAA